MKYPAIIGASVVYAMSLPAIAQTCTSACPHPLPPTQTEAVSKVKSSIAAMVEAQRQKQRTASTSGLPTSCKKTPETDQNGPNCPSKAGDSGLTKAD